MLDRDSLQIADVTGRTLVRVNSWEPKNTLPSLVPPGLGAAVRVLPLGPTEWWVVSDRIQGPQLREQVERQTGGEGIVAVDLSSAVKALRIQGATARDVLAKGCGLALDPGRFPAGRGMRTRLAQLAVVIDCIDPKPCFELYVGRSYLKYLRSWLLDAAVEFSGQSV